jgi:Protein of unknown function (DUF1440)
MTRLRDKDESKLFRGMLAGAAGGLCAAWVMNQFQLLWSKASEELKSETAREKETSSQRDSDSSEESEDATMKVAQKLARATIGRDLEREEEKKAGSAIHYTFGALAGAVYGLSVEVMPVTRVGFGTLFGALLFLIADEITVPALGLAPKPAESPLSSHLYGLSSHFVYGITTEAVRNRVRLVA